jgi:hypothetical protein
MRGPWASFLAAAALLLSAATAPAQEPTRIYGLTIPERVGGLVHGQPVDYETKSPGLGYSMRFSGPPGWVVDVYIYDLGLKTIPDDIGSGIVKGQLADVKGDIANSAGAAPTATSPSWTGSPLPTVARRDSCVRPSAICAASGRKWTSTATCV